MNGQYSSQICRTARGQSEPERAASVKDDPELAKGVTVTRILDLLNLIASARQTADVWSMATGYFADLGFARVNYGFSRFRHGASMGRPEDMLFLSTFDPGYGEMYFGGGFYARTPLYRWALDHDGLCTWRWVADRHAAGQLAAEEAQAVAQNAALGLVAGVTISFPEASPRQKGALGLAADPGLDHDDVDALIAGEGPALQAVAHAMHLRICHLPFTPQRRTLSQRQREALEWVAEGRTTQEVAMCMGISVAMVEKHLRLARQALDVETTAQAVAKGTLLNEILHNRLPPLAAE